VAAYYHTSGPGQQNLVQLCRSLAYLVVGSHHTHRFHVLVWRSFALLC
jgi:hypothetical protein